MRYLMWLARRMNTFCRLPGSPRVPACPWPVTVPIVRSGIISSYPGIWDRSGRISNPGRHGRVVWIRFITWARVSRSSITSPIFVTKGVGRVSVARVNIRGHGRLADSCIGNMLARIRVLVGSSKGRVSGRIGRSSGVGGSSSVGWALRLRVCRLGRVRLHVLTGRSRVGRRRGGSCLRAGWLWHRTCIACCGPVRRLR